MIEFFLVAGVFLAILGAWYWHWAKGVRAEVEEGAAFEWERFAKNEPDFLKGLDKATFEAVYARVHFPRFPKYLLAAIAVFLLSLPVVLGLLGAGVWLGEAFGLAPQPDDLAKYVPISGGSNPENEARNQEMALVLARNFSGFYYFFGVIGSWVLLVALFSRHYHRNRPGYLRDELIRARESQADKTLNEAPG